MIVFNQLSRDYTLGSQTVRALRDVSGEVFAGEMVALCGPSGSGKSTLLNVLGMLDTQYQGQVTFAGSPYPTGQMQAAKMRREKLGFVFKIQPCACDDGIGERGLSAAPQRLFKSRTNRARHTNARTCWFGRVYSSHAR